MKLSEFDTFVSSSDWTTDKDSGERLRIARYGLAAEVGSLASALKKKVLHHSTDQWDSSNEEIVEEIGDCLWYVTQLSQLEGGKGLASIVAADFNALPEEIELKPEFKAALDPEGYARFSRQAPALIDLGGEALIDEYQSLAFLTARTQNRELLDVCITRLLLYATSVMSRQFPEGEYHLKDDILDYTRDRTLGMLLWHLSAVSTLYQLKLSDVLAENMVKIRSISNLSEDEPTELFDERVPAHERFPRKFAITYISVSDGRLQMYYRGRPLGDELNDNSRTDDGYRFHDALHLANAAILGWSPVLRSLMKLKRKSQPDADRAEDGARARIVEEAIVKAVHSEAVRVGRLEGLTHDQAKATLFSDARQISYDFLKLVMTFAEDLEVAKCKPWEWRQAIVEGHRLFKNLKEEKQGTVTVDLTNRSVSFSPLAIPDFHGPVVDSTIEVFEAPSVIYRNLKDADRTKSEKHAILHLLGISPKKEFLEKLQISYSGDRQISVKATGEPQRQIWNRSIIGFRTKWTKVGRRWICVAMAIGAPS